MARKPGLASTLPVVVKGSPSMSKVSLVPSMVAGPMSVARKRRAMRL